MFKSLLKWILVKLENPAPSTVVTEEPKKDSLDDLAIFHVDDMQIYVYHNGSEVIKADPMTLFKRVSERMSEIQADIQLICMPAMKGWENKIDEAYQHALKCIREVYNVKPLEEGGLTEQKTFELHNHFLRFVFDVKKNSSQSQTSLPTTESASVPLQESPSTTSSGSVFG